MGGRGSFHKRAPTKDSTALTTILLSYLHSSFNMICSEGTKDLSNLLLALYSYYLVLKFST